MDINRFSHYLEEGVERIKYLVNIREAQANDAVSQLGTGRKPLARPGSAPIPRPFSPIFYGTTQNNRREFALFQEQFLDQLNLRHHNLADQVHLKLSSTLLKSKNSLLLHVWGRCVDGLKRADTAGQSALFHEYQVTYYRAFFIFAAALLSRSVRKTIPFALVSNDHAPIPVAFAQVCRAYGIPIGYIQHAEVSEKFPPLAFDFAVLNNDASLVIYSHIAQSLPPCFIIPRLRSAAQKDRLSADLPGTIRVGLFLTSLCDFENIGDVLSALHTNPLVREVLVQPHPRIGESERMQLVGHGFFVGTVNLNRIDVAVCQNTSTVIELLHHGIKTFQLFEYDHVADDYYSFVQKGIVTRVYLPDLNGSFWNKFEYSAEWESRYVDYNPSFKGKDDSRELLSHLKSYVKDGCLARKKGLSPIQEGDQVAGRPIIGCGPDDIESLFQQLVSNSPELNADDLRRALILQRFGNQAPEPLPEFDVKLRASVERLYQVRAPEVVSWMNQGGKVIGESLFSMWSALFSRFWTSDSLNDRDLKLICSQLRQKDGPIVAECQALLVCLVVRRGDIDLTLDLLKRMGGISSIHMDMRARVELGRHLFIHQDKVKSLDWRALLVRRLGGINRLRVEIIGCARPDLNLTIDHKGIEGELMGLACPSLKAELTEFVLPFYERHRSRLSFMEVFWQKRQRDAFLREVRSALQACRPFSFVRLSDGEGWLFAESPGPFRPEDERNRELHWWGRMARIDEKRELRDSARHAILRADVLGVPSIYRVLQSLGSKSTTLQNNVTFRGLLQVLSTLVKYDIGQARFADEKANVWLFRDHEWILDLAKYAKQVIIVTSVTRQTLNNIAPEFKAFQHIAIPTHHRTRQNARYEKFTRIFPEVYSDVERKVRDLSAPGVLMLNASGVAGKGLLGVAKSRGAVALDIGGAVDAWVQRIAAAKTSKSD